MNAPTVVSHTPGPCITEARAFTITGGAVRGFCWCGAAIPASMGWASLYSSKLRGYVGACSIEHWDALKALSLPGVSGYLDDSKIGITI